MKRKKTYNLRELRLASSLTMQDLCDKTGVSLSTIQVLETSKERRKNYSITAKHTLADFFHVPARLLFPEIQEQVDELLGKNRQVQMFVPREDVKKRRRPAHEKENMDSHTRT